MTFFIHISETWLSDNGTIRPVSEENAQGKPYDCDISLSNIGEKALHSHATGKTHKERFFGVFSFGLFLIQETPDGIF